MLPLGFPPAEAGFLFLFFGFLCSLGASPFIVDAEFACGNNEILIIDLSMCVTIEQHYETRLVATIYGLFHLKLHTAN